VSRNPVVEPLPVNFAGWTKWFKANRRKTLITCCDCGLTHQFQFLIENTNPDDWLIYEDRLKIMWRAKRDEELTKLIRKHNKFPKKVKS
jgi:hypothetical protein